MGCFGKEYTITLKENSKPVTHAPRRVPLSLMTILKNKLEELVKHKIIEKADGYNEWVNHLVIVEKKDKTLRLCLDPQELNSCIADEHAYTPTFDDVVTRVKGMRYFTVLDLKDGYWHVKLDEKSKTLCTFATPFGNYRFLRLPFGIKTAPSVFQKINFDIFGDIENVLIYFDDILIMGKDRKSHDETLKKVLERAREKNAKININKLQIAMEEVKYLGHIISQNEIKPDPERLMAIDQMGPPNNKKDLQTFMGVLNFLRAFIPNVAEITAPLRELLRKNVIYKWTEKHTHTFNEIKKTYFKCKYSHTI